MSGLPCSAGSLQEREQLMGSAPVARGWVALEQPGPWGAKAFSTSHLDPDVGRAIEAAAADAGVRPSLLRSPGRHADDHGPGAGRHVLVAHTTPGRSWLLEGTVDRAEELLGLDWAAVGAGDVDAVRRSLPALMPSDRPHLLVCTNGRRDTCCAVEGRPVALGAAVHHPGQVWEATHTSGHRFAPTAALLPAGTLHGRLDVDAAGRLLDEASQGRTVLAGSRGRSTWVAPGQVAELAVRDVTGELDLDAVTVDDVRPDGEHDWSVAVAHVDGRAWDVAVASRESGSSRAESCGKDAVAMRAWTWTVRERTSRAAVSSRT